MKKFFKLLVIAISVSIALINIAYAQNPSNSVAPLENNEVTTEQITESESSSEELLSKLQLSNDEIYALQKLRIQKDLETEILSWFQSRFWFISIITIIIGFVGVRSLVREFVSSEIKEAMRASAEAQAAASSARELIKDVRVESDNYRNLVDTASVAANQVNIRLEELSSRIDSEGERSVAAAEIKITALNHQVVELQNLISTLATDSVKSRSEIERSKDRLEKSSIEAKLSEEIFSSNADTRITIVQFEDEVSKKLADRIDSALTHAGFRTTNSPWGGNATPKGGIRISYMGHAIDEARYTKEIVENIFNKENIKAVIKMESKAKPISNSSSEIVVFFE